MNFPSEVIADRILTTRVVIAILPYPIRLLRCERNESIHEWLFPAGCSLLALLLHSSTDSEAAAAAVDDLLLEDIRFAEELRPLIRTRSIEAVREHPHMTSALGGRGRREPKKQMYVQGVPDILRLLRV